MPPCDTTTAAVAFKPRRSQQTNAPSSESAGDRWQVGVVLSRRRVNGRYRLNRAVTARKNQSQKEGIASIRGPCAACAPRAGRRITGDAQPLFRS